MPNTACMTILNNKPHNEWLILSGFIVIYVLLILPAHAQPISWHNGTVHKNITSCLLVAKTTSDVQNITAASAAEFDTAFRALDAPVIRLGLTEDIYWIKFTLTNNSRDSLWLQLDHAFIPNADLYYQDGANQWRVYRSGYKIPLKDKFISDHLQVFPLLPGTHQYFIRLKPLMHPIKFIIWNISSYQIHAGQQKMIFGIYAGILLFAIAINFFLFIAFHKTYYLLYGLLVLLYACSSATVMEGYLIYFFPSIDLMYTYKLVPVLDMPVLLAYCLSFLEIKKNSITLYRTGFTTCIVLLLYSVALHFIPLMAAMKINYVLSLFVFICVTSMGIMVGLKGNRMGYYFAIAYSIWFILLLLELLYIWKGWPQHIFELSYVSLAIFIESIILAFLLVKRFHWDKQADEEAKFKLQHDIIHMQARFEKDILQTKLEIQEQTLHNVSQEIHDNIGQSLTLAKLNLNLYLNQSQGGNSEQEKIIISKELIASVIQELRDIAKSLNTEYIKNVGLIAMLEQQVVILEKTGILKVEFDIQGKTERYDINKELIIFRIVQELINNIVKHAEATFLLLALQYEPTRIIIRLSDNGKGFDMNEYYKKQTKGTGLHNIIDRMTMLEGVIKIDGHPQIGTTVLLSFPKKNGQISGLDSDYKYHSAQSLADDFRQG
jgi:signal transduction histidine kinase